MKYAINISAWDGSRDLRLQRDGSWATCPDSAVLHPDDYHSADAGRMFKLQNPGRRIALGDGIFTRVPKGRYFTKYKLSFMLYGFRDVFPAYPCRDQLREVLRNADGESERLVLATNGLFYLELANRVSWRTDPARVGALEPYNKNNELLGFHVPEEELEEALSDHYNAAMFLWKEHLRCKKLYNHPFIFYPQFDTDDLLDIFIELKEIREQMEIEVDQIQVHQLIRD